jgi:N-acetylmuramic acid 6-phosphate etherase
MSTLELLGTLNDEDARVARAVRQVLPQLAVAVDLAVERIRAGGSVHYFGAGTSGRLAVIDAAELMPTFNAPQGMFVAHHAGGAGALLKAVENVEDNAELGAGDASVVGAGDVVLGLTASGRTPYVGGALATARTRGALTVLITANPRAELAGQVDHVLAVDTGPEVITGSTRLKAGTAQKLVLNSFSTAVMVRLGRTWSNLMVDMVATNAKLRGRVIRILQQASGADEPAAREALELASGELKPALLSLLAGIDPAAAREVLERHQGSVAEALRSIHSHNSPSIK